MAKNLPRLIGTAALLSAVAGYVLWFVSLQDELPEPAPLEVLSKAVAERDLAKVQVIAGSFENETIQRVAAEAQAGRWGAAQSLLSGYSFPADVANLKRGGPAAIALDVGDQKLLEAAFRGDQVYQLYHSDDYGSAKTALLDHIDYLDQMNAESGRPELRSSAQSDVMISYVRLAKLEEKYNGSQKEEYMRLASARCQILRVTSMRWRDCSEELLRRVVDQVDRLQPLP